VGICSAQDFAYQTICFLSYLVYAVCVVAIVYSACDEKPTEEKIGQVKSIHAEPFWIYMRANPIIGSNTSCNPLNTSCPSLEETEALLHRVREELISWKDERQEENLVINK